MYRPADTTNADITLLILTRTNRRRHHTAHSHAHQPPDSRHLQISILDVMTEAAAENTKWKNDVLPAHRYYYKNVTGITVDPGVGRPAKPGEAKPPVCWITVHYKPDANGNKVEGNTIIYDCGLSTRISRIGPLGNLTQEGEYVSNPDYAVNTMDAAKYVANVSHSNTDPDFVKHLEILNGAYLEICKRFADNESKPNKSVEFLSKMFATPGYTPEVGVKTIDADKRKDKTHKPCPFTEDKDYGKFKGVFKSRVVSKVTDESDNVWPKEMDGVDVDDLLTPKQKRAYRHEELDMSDLYGDKVEYTDLQFPVAGLEKGRPDIPPYIECAVEVSIARCTSWSYPRLMTYLKKLHFGYPPEILRSDEKLMDVAKALRSPMSSGLPPPPPTMSRPGSDARKSEEAEAAAKKRKAENEEDEAAAKKRKAEDEEAEYEEELPDISTAPASPEE
jgi:hypothetical protein